MVALWSQAVGRRPQAFRHSVLRYSRHRTRAGQVRPALHSNTPNEKLNRRISRSLTTNQRLSFDLDPWGKHLVTGTQDGRILVFDTDTFSPVAEREAPDCVNAISFHPTCSLLAVSCGQRHFDLDCEDDLEGTGDPSEQSRKRQKGQSAAASAIQVLEIGRSLVPAEPNTDVDSVTPAVGE